MELLMENLLYSTFILYLLSSIAFAVGVTGQKGKTRWVQIALALTVLGVITQTGFIISRIIISGYFPTSNMFEFIAFLCYALVLAFLVVYYLYRSPILGVFSMPIAVILLAYASVFPQEVQPLIPALQSHWLYIHVTTAALGQGAFAVGFVAGLIYLVHQLGEKRGGKQPFFLESIFVVMVMFLSFSILSFLFNLAGYEAEFTHVVEETEVVESYNLPPLAAPYESEITKMDSFMGMSGPLFEIPAWMQGQNAASKFNSVIWSIVVGLILYGLYRLISKRPLYSLFYPLVKRLDSELVDEITYRAIVIGYPLFTLGALIFAAIWANEAWGRPWGWDPKETWAFITWMFYSAYLHLRLSRGWFGLKSSWLAVGGFVIIMINLIVINLVISGLHSYA